MYEGSLGYCEEEVLHPDDQQYYLVHPLLNRCLHHVQVYSEQFIQQFEFLEIKSCLYCYFFDEFSIKINEGISFLLNKTSSNIECLRSYANSNQYLRLSRCFVTNRRRQNPRNRRDIISQSFK